MKRRYLGIVYVFVLLFCFQACKPQGEPVRIVLEEFTEGDQEAIGTAIADAISSNPSKFPILSANEYNNAYAYLNTLLRTLLTTDIVQQRNTYNWELVVLHDDAAKSVFTIPGGKIFMTTGFLRFIRSENEFLGVLAHEIYYADSDVVMNRLANQVDDSGFLFGDIVLGNDVNNLDEIACTARDLVFTEADINAADDYAMSLLCNFQYDAFGLKDLLEEADALPTAIEWTSTRPTTPQRLDHIASLAALCGEEEATFHERYQKFISEYLP